jgi:hypothetical protein
VDDVIEVRDRLGHELAALFALVQSIVAPCEQPPGSVAYTAASEKFRNHIVELGKKTCDYLGTFPLETEQADEAEEDFGSAPSELAEVRSAWRQLHPYIRPAIQADTLHQPTSLVDALTSRFNEIAGFDQVAFTIFHVEEFNYLHLYASEITGLTNKLAKLVGATELPEIGLIGIPSSQSSALFLNCLIAHEMGHYVAAKKKFIAHILGEADESLKITMKETYPKGNGSLQLPFRLAKWAEELFCDLFAIQMVGPCYAFAYIELYGQLQLLKFDGTLHRDRLKTGLDFYPLYPSHPFRVQQQAVMLRHSGWWKHIGAMKTRHARLLEQLVDVSDGDHKDADSDKRQQVEAFLAIVPEIVRFLGSVTGTLDDHVREFGMLNPTILAYLENGIVPSTLNVRVGDQVETDALPSFVTLINSGVSFYLERIPTLMNRIAGATIDSTKDRVFWMNKTEGWIAKALEDLRLRKRVADVGTDREAH